MRMREEDGWLSMSMGGCKKRVRAQDGCLSMKMRAEEGWLWRMRAENGLLSMRARTDHEEPEERCGTSMREEVECFQMVVTKQANSQMVFTNQAKKRKKGKNSPIRARSLAMMEHVRAGEPSARFRNLQHKI